MDFKMIEALLLASNGYTVTLDADFMHLKGVKSSTDNFYAELAKAGLRAENMPDLATPSLFIVLTHSENAMLEQRKARQNIG